MKEILRSQYQAALSMLEETLRKCPEDLWEEGTGSNAFWLVAYHALFYTHLYLQPTEEAFQPFSGHRDGVQFMGVQPDGSLDTSVIGEPYSREHLLGYVEHCRDQVEKQISAMDPEAVSGFHWIPLSKLEHQLYNLRHLQHHVGELSTMIYMQAGVEIGWVGKG